jgi:hypothetical protein
LSHQFAAFLATYSVRHDILMTECDALRPAHE